jgi:hypothetical protein
LISATNFGDSADTGIDTGIATGICSISGVLTGVNVVLSHGIVAGVSTLLLIENAGISSICIVNNG